MNQPKYYAKLRPATPTPADDLCQCSGDKPYKLMAALGENPIHCIDCNLEINLEKLDLSQELVEAIADWRRVYAAIDHLWLDSREYETLALKELVNIDSPVHRRGMSVCKEINQFRSCYYWYFQDQSAENYDPITTCPSCAQSFTLYTKGIFPQFICERCWIISVAK